MDQPHFTRDDWMVISRGLEDRANCMSIRGGALMAEEARNALELKKRVDVYIDFLYDNKRVW